MRFGMIWNVSKAAALGSAQGKDGLAAIIERFRFFNEILVWHAHGEELAVFPAVEKVAPLVAEVYVIDHYGLDRAFDELNRSYAAQDPLQVARATAAFRFHLKIHLLKEDTHLYRIFREHIPLAEQGKVLGTIASAVPQERSRTWWRGCTLKGETVTITNSGSSSVSPAGW